MKIGELALQAGCDVQTVRYYEREGLLAPPARDASSYRRYAGDHLARLHFIRHCRALDIPLAEVRQLLHYAEAPRESCRAVDALLDEHIERVRRQRAVLGALEQQLVALRRQCDATGASAQGPCAILDAFTSATSGQPCACHPATAERGRRPTAGRRRPTDAFSPAPPTPARRG